MRDWIWESPASMHSYKYLEILISLIWSIVTWEGNKNARMEFTKTL